MSPHHVCLSFRRPFDRPSVYNAFLVQAISPRTIRAKQFSTINKHTEVVQQNIKLKFCQKMLMLKKHLYGLCCVQARSQ